MKTRSKVALELSIAAMFARSKRVYMWTFTFPLSLHAWQTPSAWTALTRLLQDYYGKIEGVRVMEMHKTHGVHFHCLIDTRLNVHIVRRMAKRCGFGRIHVAPVDHKGALYVAKYVGKQSERPNGMKAWTAISRNWATRKSDIVVQSTEARAMRQAYQEAVQSGMPKGARYTHMILARNRAASEGYQCAN